VLPAAGRAATPPTAPAPASAAVERPIASPALRRRAWELGIDLRKVTPTGTAGRIVQADLDAIVAAGLAPATGPAQPEATVAAARPGAMPPAAPTATLRDDEQRLPVIGLRRRIALQMQEAKRRIPHFSYVEECDVTEVEALRATLNAREGAARGHLTLLPLLVRALVLALREFPQINARFDDEAGVVTRHGAVHLGVATQTPHGLLVPVLRHAEALDLWSIAAEVARLAESARAGHSTRAELSGSTITVTSLGPLGGIVSTPIINRPEVAIVGVNRIVERPVVRGGQIVVRRTMNLSSSFDHRVIDGADAAAFVQAMRARLEQPALLFVPDAGPASG
jgi:2-oxoisovalerate dehydrogenase E2 component (dihydrolipoyl transacylase)